MAFAVAVDIGGTFTDLVAYDHDSHSVVYAKSPTTYGNFVDGILDCFGKVKLAPSSAAIRPGCASAAACVSSARRAAKRTPASRGNTPAAMSAVTCPSE